MQTAAMIRCKLDSDTLIRIATAVENHPRFAALYDGLDGLYAWLERAQQHYLNEVNRIGPTKARRRLGRIVNEVALTGVR